MVVDLFFSFIFIFFYFSIIVITVIHRCYCRWREQDCRIRTTVPPTVLPSRATNKRRKKNPKKRKKNSSERTFCNVYDTLSKFPNITFHFAVDSLSAKANVSELCANVCVWARIILGLQPALFFLFVRSFLFSFHWNRFVAPWSFFINSIGP